MGIPHSAYPRPDTKDIAGGLQPSKRAMSISSRWKKREGGREERIVVTIVVLRACNTPLIVRQVCVHSECNISCQPRAAHVPLSVCFGLHCHHGYKRGRPCQRRVPARTSPGDGEEGGEPRVSPPFHNSPRSGGK